MRLRTSSTARAARSPSQAATQRSASTSAPRCCHGWRPGRPTCTLPFSRATASAPSGSRGMAPRSRRRTTTSSFPWPTAETASPRSSGGSAISNTGSAALLKACGCRRRPLTPRRSRCWPSRGSSSPFWLRTRRAARGASASRPGATSPAGGSTPRRPYRVSLPSGRTIAVFFYDGVVSGAVAFESLLKSGDRLAERLLGRFDAETGAEPGEDQLVHIATDGETYGHHHRFGDMALAYALRKIETQGGVPLDQLRRVPRRAPACRRGDDPRGHILELLARSREMEGRLRLPHAFEERARVGERPCARRSIPCATRWRLFSRRAPASSSGTPGRPATTPCSSCSIRPL